MKKISVPYATTFDVTSRRSSMIDWIINYELIAFFALTFVFTWTLDGIAAIANLENRDTSNLIILIGAYTPTITALVLSAIANPGSIRLTLSRWFLLFIPVFILAAGIEGLDHIFWGHQIDLSLILVSVILVMLAAGVMTLLLTNRADVHLRLTSMNQERFWVYLPVALGLWPLLVLAANAISKLIGLSLPPNPNLPNVAFPLLLLESFFWAFLFGGGLNEEAGWRGFALPRLQNRFSPLIASIIIGVFWGLWHVPIHVIDVGFYGGNPWGAVMRIMDIPRAILFTWLYNRTRGNLLIVILFHAAVNTTSYFTSRSHVVVFALVIILAILLVVMDKMWQKCPSSSQTAD